MWISVVWRLVSLLHRCLLLHVSALFYCFMFTFSHIEIILRPCWWKPNIFSFWLWNIEIFSHVFYTQQNSKTLLVVKTVERKLDSSTSAHRKKVVSSQDCWLLTFTNVKVASCWHFGQPMCTWRVALLKYLPWQIIFKHSELTAYLLWNNQLIVDNALWQQTATVFCISSCILLMNTFHYIL